MADKLKLTREEVVDRVKRFNGYFVGDLASDWLLQDAAITRLEGELAEAESDIDEMAKEIECLREENTRLTAVVDRLHFTADGFLPHEHGLWCDHYGEFACCEHVLGVDSGMWAEPHLHDEIGARVHISQCYSTREALLTARTAGATGEGKGDE